MNPPSLDRAVAELAAAEADLERSDRGLQEIARRIEELNRRHQFELQKLQVVFAVQKERKRESLLKADLRRQEERQVRAKVALFRLTMRRARYQNDERALRDALSMARELGIPEGQAVRFSD